MTNGSTVIPCLRYRNAAAAIEWLCETFGFEKCMVVPGDGDEIAHAQLKHGDGMVMLGSATDSEYGRLMKHPDETGGAATQTSYVVVSDVDSICKRAKATGARIAIDVKDEDYGGRSFSCYDLEGHLWNFGSYNPWE